MTTKLTGNKRKQELIESIANPLPELEIFDKSGQPPAKKIAAPAQKRAAASPEKAQANRWVYTLNNPTHPIEFNSDTMVYHCYGEEKGESGTLHYQGFIIFKNRKRLSFLKEFNPRCHWEPAKGTNQQASDYCKKDGKWKEDGVLPDEPHKKGGKANQDKWRAISDYAKLGQLDKIDEEHPKIFVGHYRTLKQMRLDNSPKLKDLDTIENIWYFGESGAGKSLKARTDNPEYYPKPCNKWWDGYQLQDVVIIDDFDKNHHVLGHHLKIWGDRYPYTAETKGGGLHIRPKKVIITSQYQIDDIWEDAETREAIHRRFKSIHVKREDWDNPIMKYLNGGSAGKKPPLENESKELSESMEAAPDPLSQEQPTLGQLLLQDEKLKKDYENIVATDREKLPKRLQPPNVYFPDTKPLQFSGTKLTTKTLLCEESPIKESPPPLEIVEISDDEDEMEDIEHKRWVLPKSYCNIRKFRHHVMWAYQEQYGKDEGRLRWLINAIKYMKKEGYWRRLKVRVIAHFQDVRSGAISDSGYSEIIKEICKRSEEMKALGYESPDTLKCKAERLRKKKFMAERMGALLDEERSWVAYNSKCN